MEGAIDDMFNAMGEKSEGILTGSVEVASELVKNYEAVGKALMSLVAVYGSYKTALIATLAVQKAASFVENIRLVAMFRKELGLATAAQQAFNITAKCQSLCVTCNCYFVCCRCAGYIFKELLCCR